jgi:DnaA-homolog protein
VSAPQAPVGAEGRAPQSTAQLPLGLGLPDWATFAGFHPGPNAEALHAVRECAAGTGEPFVYVWGGAGRGKTHLLQAACRGAGERGLAAAAVALGEAGRAFPPEALEGLEQLALVCLDDLQAVAGRSGWELALFDLFNRVRESGARLIVAACGRPGEIGLSLPDLHSRLGWGLALPLHTLDDADLLAALQRRAAARGLELPDDVAGYLLRRCPRDLAALGTLLERLDRASLAAQRRLTVPFVKAFLSAPPR